MSGRPVKSPPDRWVGSRVEKKVFAVVEGRIERIPLR